ncbi:MAG: N-acetyltransferase [Magnetospirillum sp.]|nr:N-acetyltransferase [Magnetospirillum sp.]
MSGGHHRYSLAVLSGLDEISAGQWDACAGDANPFVSHAFLSALEQSGSATTDTGWLPRHLVVADASGKVVAASPLYLKGHSYGEYVFDWGWAEAYQRAGGTYYPKLQSAVPFTPVTGPRLMVRPGEDAETLADLLAAGMVGVAERLGVSSLHVTFPTGAECERLGRAGFLTRMGRQYHWRNQGYGSFDDFLAQLSSRKRKSIRHERQAVAAQGFTISTLVGAEVTSRHWDIFHAFYSRTVGRKWGEAYLRRDFFELLSASALGERVVLVWAEADGRPVAAAFNMLGGDTLYGRTWAAPHELPFLHFEACYYRAIDFAIANRLAVVEAGAQGEHKVSRGYLPVPTWSAHWIADPGFRRAVERFLVHECQAVATEMAESAGPFRRI